MKIRALDINNDWKFGKGGQNYLNKVDALKLHIKTRLKSWKGDCFYLPNEGVDWNNFLGVGTKTELDRDVKRVILQTQGVLRINNYTSILEERNITINCEIVTIYGKIFLEGITV